MEGFTELLEEVGELERFLLMLQTAFVGERVPQNATYLGKIYGKIHTEKKPEAKDLMKKPGSTAAFIGIPE